MSMATSEHGRKGETGTGAGDRGVWWQECWKEGKMQKASKVLGQGEVPVFDFPPGQKKTSSSKLGRHQFQKVPLSAMGHTHTFLSISV